MPVHRLETVATPARAESCSACRRPVTWARLRGPGGYRSIAIETCRPGAGDLALALALFDDGRGPIVVEVVNVRTSYRAHRDHCPKGGGEAQAHSAAGFKQRAKVRDPSSGT